MENRLELGEVAGWLHTGRTCLPQHINRGLDMPFGSLLQQNEADQMLAEKPSGKHRRAGVALWMFFCQLLFPSLHGRRDGTVAVEKHTGGEESAAAESWQDISPTSPRTVLINFVIR